MKKEEEYEDESQKDIQLYFLEKISNDLKFLKKRVIQAERKELFLVKWSLAASVLDRLFFIVSIIYTVVTLVVIILADLDVYFFN